jgi:hypothetical protein
LVFHSLLLYFGNLSTFGRQPNVFLFDAFPEGPLGSTCS